MTGFSGSNMDGCHSNPFAILDSMDEDLAVADDVDDGMGGDQDADDELKFAQVSALPWDSDE